MFNVIRMLSKMSGQRIEAESTQAIALDDILRDGVRRQADVAAFASCEPEMRQLAVMIWHYHDDDLPGPEAAVTLQLGGLPTDAEQAQLTHYRVDQQHGNAYASWLRMGSPVAPDLRQYKQLQDASRLTPLADQPLSAPLQDGSTTLEFQLPRHAVSLVILQW